MCICHDRKKFECINLRCVNSDRIYAGHGPNILLHLKRLISMPAEYLNIHEQVRSELFKLCGLNIIRMCSRAKL